nr:uncharacterized protein LOC113715784 [Coffea arabica]
MNKILVEQDYSTDKNKYSAVIEMGGCFQNWDEEPQTSSENFLHQLATGHQRFFLMIHFKTRVRSGGCLNFSTHLASVQQLPLKNIQKFFCVTLHAPNHLEARVIHHHY